MEQGETQGDMGLLATEPNNFAPNKQDPALHDALWRYECISKSKELDLLFRMRVLAMAAFLRTYMMDEEMKWIEASLYVATMSFGRGEFMARHLCKWVRKNLADHRYMPVNLYGTWKVSIINDEDFAGDIHNHLQSLGKEYLRAEDVQEYLNTPEMLSKLGHSKTISVQTARKWMNVMGYRYGKEPEGMYIDGHEREDVVAYRQNVFLPLWAELEKQMALGNVDNSSLNQTILVTHDESTFYANDQRKTKWVHKSTNAKPRTKGEC